MYNVLPYFQLRAGLYWGPCEVRLSSKRQQFLEFLSEFRRWAESRPDILAVALLGSYARNAATEASDIDLVIIAREPQAYLQDTRWARCFGTIDREQIENYGKLASLRVWYSDAHEVEFGFTDQTWSALPLDAGTKKVVFDGIQVLYERASILSELWDQVNKAETKPT